MNVLTISNILTDSKQNPITPLNAKAGVSFADILQSSLLGNPVEAKKSSMTASSSSSDSAADKIGRLASEKEDKYCSMCGSRIKEDGTCPICIVPIFLSGNSGSRSQGISQTHQAHSSATENKAALSYHRRKAAFSSEASGLGSTSLRR